MFLLLLSGFFAITKAAEHITLYGDVHNDVEFFTSTFPWIIDNIGGDLTVEYFMLGSGRYSVPQMCVLKELKKNAFLQAQYLKCEAEGYPSQYCLCETGVDPKIIKQCVLSGGHLASLAAANYSQLGIDFSPVIALGPKSTVFGVEDKYYLQKICTIFGDKLPRGCVKPFYCNHSEIFAEKRALAYFGDCYKEYFRNCEVDEGSSRDDTEPYYSESYEDEYSGSSDSYSSENEEPESDYSETSENVVSESELSESYEYEEPEPETTTRRKYRPTHDNSPIW